MRHFYQYFFLNFPDYLFLLNHRYFDYFLLKNLIRDNLFYNFSNYHLFLLCIRYKPWNLSIKIDSLFIRDNKRYLPFYLNISIMLEYFLINYLYLFYFLFCLSNIDGFLDDLLDLDVLFLGG